VQTQCNPIPNSPLVSVRIGLGVRTRPHKVMGFGSSLGLLEFQRMSFLYFYPKKKSKTLPKTKKMVSGCGLRCYVLSISLFYDTSAF
jgi:hypothetical protein